MEDMIKVIVTSLGYQHVSHSPYHSSYQKYLYSHLLTSGVQERGTKKVLENKREREKRKEKKSDIILMLCYNLFLC